MSSYFEQNLLLLKTYMFVNIGSLIGLIGMSMLFFECMGGQTKIKDQGKDILQTVSESSSVNTSQAGEGLTDRPTTNLKPNQIIQSPMTIIVNSEGKWGGFEGELGTAELIDRTGKPLGLCILSTKENWMVKGPVIYNCDLTFSAQSAGKGKIVIKNNNPTGMVEHDKSFEIPVGYSASE